MCSKETCIFDLSSVTMDTPLVFFRSRERDFLQLAATCSGCLDKGPKMTPSPPTDVEGLGLADSGLAKAATLPGTKPFHDPPSIPAHAPMTPAKDAASDDPHATRLIQLLKAVEVAHAMHEAAPGRRTPQGTSDSRCLDGHDHVLLQCRRERRAFSDTLPMLSSFELLLSDDKRENFEHSAPVVLPKTHSRNPGSASFTKGSILSSSTTASASRAD
jgi:hypothetical protein